MFTVFMYLSLNRSVEITIEMFKILITISMCRLNLLYEVKRIYSDW